MFAPFILVFSTSADIELVGPTVYKPTDGLREAQNMYKDLEKIWAPENSGPCSGCTLGTPIGLGLRVIGRNYI